MTQETLSAVIIRMAETVLKNPASGVYSDAAHAAILLAHVAWNREVAGDEFLADGGYLPRLLEFQKSSRVFGQYLKSIDWEDLITTLREFKHRYYPDDKRFITECRFKQGKVRVVSHEYIGKVKL